MQHVDISRLRREFEAALEDMRTRAATLPRQSGDRRFLVTMAKAIQNFVAEMAPTLAPHETHGLQDILRMTRQLTALFAEGLNQDDPRVQDLRRQIRAAAE